MNFDKLSRLWLPAILLLALIIIISSVILVLNRDRGIPVIITETQSRSFQGQAIIEGAVANPGSYPISSTDSLEDIFTASGGLEDSADLSRVFVYIPQVVTGGETARININTSNTMLLESLPGIGETRAQAIIDYRSQNGDFSCIEDILNVPGIGNVTFEKIKDLITVTN